ncbi:mucin-12-like [Saimiri boliviensis]|uniref:mucin-12-like n=1 Tax=Saimiri boliviensis TaxID=27679 RepID=UPI003D777E6F
MTFLMKTEQCTRKAAKEYAQLYYVDVLDGKLACVTKCTTGTKLQVNCNQGRCQLQHGGPCCLRGYDVFQAWQKEGNPGNCQKTAAWEGHSGGF